MTTIFESVVSKKAFIAEALPCLDDCLIRHILGYIDANDSTILSVSSVLAEETTTIFSITICFVSCSRSAVRVLPMFFPSLKAGMQMPTVGLYVFSGLANPPKTADAS